MIKVKTIRKGKMAVEIYKMKSGLYWPLKYLDYEIGHITSQNSRTFSLLSKAILHANQFINQSVPALKTTN